MAIFKPRNARKKSTSDRPIASAKASKVLELSIDRLADDGRGIAKAQGKTIFVDGALDGETVLARFGKQTSQYSEATVQQLVVSSADRLQPPCPVFSRCGGCSVQYMPAKKQLAFKQTAVLSQLSRWAKLSPKTVLPPITSEEYGYRQRVRLAVNYNKLGEISLGFREPSSHRVVDVDHCQVLEADLQALLPLLKQGLSSLPSGVIGHVELINTVDTIGIVIRHIRPLSVDYRQPLQACLSQPHKPCQVWFQAQKGGGLENSAGQEVEPQLHYILRAAPSNTQSPNSITLSFHPQSFVQSNRQVNEQMVEQAIALLAPQADEHIVDLFCGVGNFSLVLAKYAKRVTAIEGVQAMVQQAQYNAAANQVDNVDFFALDLAKSRLSLPIICDNSRFSDVAPVAAILLDPPRSGAKAICQHIRELSPKRIVYVSCDSSTFARDAKILADNGYSLSALGVMDMFPQTAHIELMALFTKNKKHLNKHTKTGIMS